jgi:hypothetical protein
MTQEQIQRTGLVTVGDLINNMSSAGSPAFSKGGAQARTARTAASTPADLPIDCFFHVRGNQSFSPPPSIRLGTPGPRMTHMHAGYLPLIAEYRTVKGDFSAVPNVSTHLHNDDRIFIGFIGKKNVQMLLCCPGSYASVIKMLKAFVRSPQATLFVAAVL